MRVTFTKLLFCYAHTGHGLCALARIPGAPMPYHDPSSFVRTSSTHASAFVARLAEGTADDADIKMRCHAMLVALSALPAGPPPA